MPNLIDILSDAVHHGYNLLSLVEHRGPQGNNRCAIFHLPKAGNCDCGIEAARRAINRARETLERKASYESDK